MTPLKVSLTFGALDTVKSKLIMENGWIERMVIVMPNFSGAPTATIAVLDENGDTVWSLASVANNGTTIVGSDISASEKGGIPVDNKYTLQVTLTAAAAGTVVVRSYLRSLGKNE